MNMKKKIIVAFVILIVLLSGCSPEKKSEVMTDEVTIIAPSSIGGGWDITAKAMQDVLQKQNFIDQDIRIMNIVGAGGELGWKYTRQQQGNVLALNSSLLITNHLLGQSQITYKDFTPIATLATEWEVLVVAKDSSISSAKSLMEQLKETPESYKIGVSPRLGNDDHLSFVLASKQAGIQPEVLGFYIYENSAQVVAALLKRQIDAATMTLAEAKKYYEIDQIKIIAISSAERLTEIPEIPTWSEQGIDLVFEHWRGIMGPPSMTKEEIQFWDQAIGEMVKTKDWKDMLQKYGWNDFYKNSSETAKFLEEQEEMYKNLMKLRKE